MIQKALSQARPAHLDADLGKNTLGLANNLLDLIDSKDLDVGAHGEFGGLMEQLGYERRSSRVWRRSTDDQLRHPMLTAIDDCRQTRIETKRVVRA